MLLVWGRCPWVLQRCWCQGQQQQQLVLLLLLLVGLQAGQVRCG
jgi:hypothetical protein